MGENVTILNGEGLIASGKLIGNDRGCARIMVQKTVQSNRPERGITLLQATLKGSNNEYIIREGTAIGAAKMVFFEAKNSECRLKGRVGDKLIRWRAIAIEGCKQSGNPFLPEISYAESIEGINLFPFGTKILCGLDGNAKPLALGIMGDTAGMTCVAIGPEGDFSTAELEHLRRNGFVECKLSKNILRSETAAIYALSVWDQLENISLRPIA